MRSSLRLPRKFAPRIHCNEQHMLSILSKLLRSDGRLCSQSLMKRRGFLPIAVGSFPLIFLRDEGEERSESYLGSSSDSR